MTADLSADLSADDGECLIQVAKSSIEHGLEYSRSLDVDAQEYSPALQVPASSFVTLRHGRRLRGCVGGLEVRWPLVVDVAQHAYGAAFGDKRFSPFTGAELEDLNIHVSVLSPLADIDFANEQDLLDQLRPGVDGLLIRAGNRRATFLPAVWDSLSDASMFLAHLKQKARIDADCTDYLASRYTVQSFPNPFPNH